MEGTVNAGLPANGVDRPSCDGALKYAYHSEAIASGVRYSYNDISESVEEIEYTHVWVQGLERDRIDRLHRILEIHVGYELPAGIQEGSRNNGIWVFRWEGDFGHGPIAISGNELKAIGKIVDHQLPRDKQVELEETTEFIETKVIDEESETVFSIFHVDPNEDLDTLMKEVEEWEQDLVSSSLPQKQLDNIKHITVWYDRNSQGAA